MPKKNDQVMFRVEPELKARFTQAVATEAKMHGFEEPSESRVFREFMRSYILRVESVAESASANELATVLKKAKGKRA